MSVKDKDTKGINKTKKEMLIAVILIGRKLKCNHKDSKWSGAQTLRSLRTSIKLLGALNQKPNAGSKG